MGAELWYHLAPWHPDPREALSEVQARFLAENYDLPALLQQHLESAREAVRLTEAEGDPYDLQQIYRDEVAFVEEVSSHPLPDQPQQQIELLRKVFANSGQGIGNILDVTGVSKRAAMHVARQLPPNAIRRLCQTDRPTLQQAEAAVGPINEKLGRGESVCFPIYAEGLDQLAGWYFVGNTVD
jgi:hypothetical protein